jgi:hypothetical protein
MLNGSDAPRGSHALGPSRAVRTSLDVQTTSGAIRSRPFELLDGEQRDDGRIPGQEVRLVVLERRYERRDRLRRRSG